MSEDHLWPSRTQCLDYSSVRWYFELAIHLGQPCSVTFISAFNVDKLDSIASIWMTKNANFSGLFLSACQLNRLGFRDRSQPLSFLCKKFEVSIWVARLVLLSGPIFRLPSWTISLARTLLLLLDETWKVTASLPRKPSITSYWHRNQA